MNNWNFLLNCYAVIIYIGIAFVVVGIGLSVWSDLHVKKKIEVIKNERKSAGSR